MPLGYHVSKTATPSNNMTAALSAALDRLESHKFAQVSAQIFVTGPQSFRELLTEDDKKQIASLVVERNLMLVIHGAYVDNPWSGSAGSIHNIRQEMKIAKQINATGVVVHLSKSAALPANVQTVLCELAKNMPSDVLETVTLWLEIHTAKPCDSTFETPEKIRSLFSAVDRSNSGLKVGLCIDSAHVFSSGTSFETYDDTLSWLQDVEKSLHGHEIMFHLNDSASTLASGKDVHAPLCGGNIWQGYHPTRGTKDFQTCGIHAILENAVAANRMVILERNPAHLEADLDLLASLHYFQ